MYNKDEAMHFGLLRECCVQCRMLIWLFLIESERSVTFSFQERKLHDSFAPGSKVLESKSSCYLNDQTDSMADCRQDGGNGTDVVGLSNGIMGLKRRLSIGLYVPTDKNNVHIMVEILYKAISL